MKGHAVIALAIVFMGCAIALAIGLGLGLRPSVVLQPNSSPEVLCQPTQQKKTTTETTTETTTTTTPLKRRESVTGEYRMATVQTDVRECSQIGMDILAGKCGSAVDAAIAAVICVGTVYFQGSGVGGGQFAVIYDTPRGETNKSVDTIISRETFPMTGAPDMYLNKTVSSKYTGTAVGVPGELAGLHTAWLRYGRVPWADLIKPSIKLAEQGFTITNYFAKAIKAKEQAFTQPGHSMRKLMTKPDGTLYKAGDVMRRPLYARTLSTIADDPYSFYNGTLADQIVADIKDAGGIITKDDLEQYRSRTRPPVVGPLTSLGLTMYSVEPPSSGVVVQYILRILDGFSFNNDSLKDVRTSVDTYHKLIEALKFGYGRRSALGDQMFYNVSQVVQNMSDEAFIAATRRKIDLTMTRDLSYYDHAYDIVNDAGTAQMSIIAPDGGAVGITSTINFGFGSQVYGRRTGIMFNNQMDDFSVPGAVNGFNISSSPSNYPEPGKMPMSSMSPSILLNHKGEVAAVIGASGGPRIITGIVNVILNSLYFGKGLGESTDMARLHHQLLPDVIQYEDGFDEAILQGLRQMKHKTKLLTRKSFVGSALNFCATCVGDSCPRLCIAAVSDGRKEGHPYGY